ncbi:hypothetical protein LK03_05250 [Pseudomonas cremoricolorata]|uniref:Uncharacterized protein n=1 Tax=Pseudomonas cremoricolorata TaxID=157783 RepID=A0A089WQG0_9PSED|nr:hypothetical protein LK03_05250 [Pseudomonas cremoricolorata]
MSVPGLADAVSLTGESNANDAEAAVTLADSSSAARPRGTRGVPGILCRRGKVELFIHVSPETLAPSRSNQEACGDVDDARGIQDIPAKQPSAYN